MATARSERLPVIGVREVEDRYNKADLAEEKRRARTGAANGGPITPRAEDILALLDGPNSVVFLPFRRQQNEMEAMLAEICSQYASKVVNSAQNGNSPWDRDSSAQARLSGCACHDTCTGSVPPARMYQCAWCSTRLTEQHRLTHCAIPPDRAMEPRTMSDMCFLALPTNGGC